MKLAISNIAWAPEDASAVYRMMQEKGVRGLEIAPALAFPSEPDPFVPSYEAVSALKAELAYYDIALVSMQSLLFGVTGAELFGDRDARERLNVAIRRAIRLGEMLEIGNLVFGSPTNRRYPDTMSAQDACQQALETFQQLGNEAQAAGTTLAIEPNPAAYNTNFLTTVASAARFVHAADHPAIALNFDVGALIMNDEIDVPGLVEEAGGRVSHVHLSEPQLAPAPADVDHAQNVVNAIMRTGYDRWFSIEMRRPSGGLAAVDAALARGVEAVSSAGSVSYA